MSIFVLAGGKMIKAVFIDVGGVVIDLDMERCKRTFRERCGTGRMEEYLDPCHQKGLISDLEAGAITVDGFYSEALKYCRPGTTPQDIADSFHSLLVGVKGEKAECIRRLARKYVLFILSNNNEVCIGKTYSMFAEAGIPIDGTFRDAFFSFRLKMLKPSREIYLEAVRRSGFEAGEILFVDDSSSNVEAAREVGITAVLYEPSRTLSETLTPFLPEAFSPEDAPAGRRKLRSAELGRMTPQQYRSKPASGLAVVLDNIRSAYNVGSIFRSSDAFGVDRIVLCGISAVPPSAEIHKSALGAEDAVRWEHYDSTSEAVRALKKEGYTVVAVEQAAGAVRLDDFSRAPGSRYAFVFGNEVDGVAQGVVDEADLAVEIPQYGTKHSLNVAVSAGTVLWEAVRKNK